MRLLLLCAAVLFAVGCAPDPKPNPPPSGQFYFPTGLAFHEENDAGVLFVASSNFDKRFDRGMLSLVSLSALTDVEGNPLPAVGATDGGRAQVVQDLGSVAEVDIQSFGGEIALWRTTAFTRAFIASRAENNPFQFVDAVNGRLSCPYASAEAPKDCITNAPSLVAKERSETGLPRAPAPSGVYVSDAVNQTPAEVFISHFQSADSPWGTNKNRQSFIVRTDAENPRIVESTTGDDASFIPIGVAGTSSVVATPKWIIASGRFLAENGGPLLRLVNRGNPAVVINAGLEGAFHSLEARGLAVTSPQIDEPAKTIFLAARQPDVLLVASLLGANTDAPFVRLIRAVPLPSNPNDVKLVTRANAEPLAVISCSGDDSVVIYDAELGAVVARLSGVGNQPYALAVQQAGAGARIFVTNFADGRVAVIDIADTSRPSEARIVAHLGRNQQCVTTGTCP